MARSQESDFYENLPEPDVLDGFASPRKIKCVYGQEKAESEFLNSLKTNRIHHAWIIAGPRGVGKATLSYFFSRLLLAGDIERKKIQKVFESESETAFSRLISNLSHPDLLVLRRPYDFRTNKLRTEISIDEVRRLKGFLSHGKSLGSSKVVIVDPADELNINAANAILKSIEEPTSDTFFFLITSSLETLLPTIRSRCRILICSPLSNENLKKALLQAFSFADENIALRLPIGEEWTKLVLLSEGSVGKALQLLSIQGISLYDRLLVLLTQLPLCNWKDIHSLADELVSPSSESKFELFFELLLSTLSRLILLATHKVYHDQEGQLSSQLIKNSHLPEWADLWNTISQIKADVEILNLDKKALILRIFHQLSLQASS